MNIYKMLQITALLGVFSLATPVWAMQGMSDSDSASSSDDSENDETTLAPRLAFLNEEVARLQQQMIAAEMQLRALFPTRESLSELTIAVKQRSQQGQLTNFNLPGLPQDVQRIIQMMALQEIAQSGIKRKEAIKNLANFTLVNKSFHAFANNAKNTKAWLTTLAATMLNRNELEIAEGLKNMPGIQSTQVQQWLTQRKEQIPVEEELLRCRNPQTLEQLLAAGVAIDARDTNGSTPLMLACERGADLDYIQKLIQWGANIHLCNKMGKNALIRSSYSLANTKEILKHKPDVNHKDYAGDTALMLCVGHNSCQAAQVAQELLAAGADVNAQNNDGRTALMYEVANPNGPGITKMLLQNNADVNKQDSRGETALMKAASKASSAKRMLPIIQMLLDAGADVQVRDTYGQTALDKARFATGHKTSSNPIVELLQKRLDQQKKGM